MPNARNQLKVLSNRKGRFAHFVFYALITAFFLSGCSTAQKKIDSLNQDIARVSAKERLEMSELEKAKSQRDVTDKLLRAEREEAKRQRNAASERARYLRSSNGRKTYVNGKCVLPPRSSSPPNNCSTGRKALAEVGPVCTAVALCIAGVGEALEFKIQEGQPWRNAFRRLGNSAGNTVATNECNKAAGLEMDGADLFVSLGSAFTNIDDKITGGFSVLKCTTLLSSECEAKYSVWENTPYDMKRECSRLTKPVPTAKISNNDLADQLSRHTELVKSKTAALSQTRKTIASLRQQLYKEKQKTAPRKAGDVVISF